jgi:hypothetical protein
MFSHGHTCGLNVPSLVNTYQSGLHCFSLIFSLQKYPAHGFGASGLL